MRTHRVIVLLAVMSLVMACNFPLFAPATQPSGPQQQPSATPADTQTPSAPTASSVPPPPDATATATGVPTPSVPQVTPISVNVNCRSGPDVAYDSISVLMFESSAQVAGRSDDSTWWYIHDPSSASSFCWVAASVVTISGPLGAIPVIKPPAAVVSDVTVGADVPNPASCGGPNAVTFYGTITTNGAATVKYQWEITGDKTNTTAPQTLKFLKATTKDAADPGAYTVDCGKYTITLHVLSPNDTSASEKFKVEGP